MSRGSLPFTSFSAASTVGPGTARDLEGVYRLHTMCVAASGMTNVVTVKLEGSLDNANWLELATVTPSGGGTVVSSASVTSHLVRYVRANLTNISGTVTSVAATIATGGE